MATELRTPRIGLFGTVARSLPTTLSEASLRLVLYVVGPISLLTAWHLASQAYGSAVLFPGPSETWAAFVSLVDSGELLRDAAASLARIATGFTIGTLGGFVVGLAAGNVGGVRAVLHPYIQFFRFISPIAWLSMALLWLGSGEASKVALIVYTTTFIVMVNTMEGVFAVPRNRHRAALCFGANPWQRFCFVVVPSSLPYVITGARLAMANSFATIVAAEMLAADVGLGFLGWVSRQWLAVDAIFVAIICLGLLGLLADRLVVILAYTVFRRYRLSR